MTNGINIHELYDIISEILTNYEGNGEPDMKDDPAPLYALLCQLQNDLEDHL